MDDKLPCDLTKKRKIVVHQSPNTSTGEQNKNDEENVELNENIIQVIDLEGESSEKSPLFILFPDLEQEFPDEKELFNRIQSTTDMTRLLQGKRAHFQLLKPCQKLKIESRLSVVMEGAETESNENL